MTRMLEHSIADRRTPAFDLPIDIATDVRSDIWSEFKPHLTQLEAVVTDNYISGSDPVIHVRDLDGRNWTVELASRARNSEIGLKESAALPGDPIRIIGRRTRHFGEQRIKAVHLVIAERSFDLYPGSIG